MGCQDSESVYRWHYALQGVWAGVRGCGFWPEHQEVVAPGVRGREFNSLVRVSWLRAPRQWPAIAVVQPDVEIAPLHHACHLAGDGRQSTHLQGVHVSIIDRANAGPDGFSEGQRRSFGLGVVGFVGVAAWTALEISADEGQIGRLGLRRVGGCGGGCWRR